MADQPHRGDRSPLWPGPSDIAGRLDRLEQRLADLEALRPAVESALVAQAARIETVLAAARRDLAEVAGTPADRAKAAADEVRAAVTAATGPTEALVGAVEAIHTRVVEVADDLAAHHEAQAARVEARLAQGTSDALTEVRSAGTRMVEQLVERLDAHAAGLEDAVASVTALQGSVQDRLDAMEREAALERTRLAAAFADQLADEVPTWESLGDPAPPAPRPARVQPSRRARPVRPSASDPRDPAAVRRALAAVRGLGPSRQSALMDHFGTLAAIREATDEELLEVRGIGPALLDDIREAAGGDAGDAAGKRA